MTAVASGVALRTQPGARVRVDRLSFPLMLGMAASYLSVVVLLPLAAVVWHGTSGGPAAFWRAITAPQTLASLALTTGAAVVVVLVNAVLGVIVAWVLVRDRFPGQGLVNAVVDLPFALPTIVAGLTLLALYGPNGPAGINVAYTRAGVVLALLFVTFPFVVRAVQPVLLEADREMEEAAALLGAGRLTIFRRVILPNLMPAVLSGSALAFARAMGEFGGVVLLSGNVPFQTEVASVHIFGRLESGNPAGAAAVATLLLGASLAVLCGLNLLQRRGLRHVA
jgi:sulfate transport system permease protein